MEVIFVMVFLVMSAFLIGIATERQFHKCKPPYCIDCGDEFGTEVERSPDNRKICLDCWQKLNGERT